MLSELSSFMNTNRAGDANSVTLKRGIQTTTAVPATPFSVNAIADEEYGGLLDMQARNYRIEAADYLIDGVAVEPQTGDIIVDGDEQYELNVAGNSEVCWEWHDVSHTTYNIFTNRLT